MKTPYETNIDRAARINGDYRRVLFTGALSQLVVMSIPPGGSIGEETHEQVEQTLVCVSGTGETILEGIASPFHAGDVVVVTPHSRHDVRNVGEEPLKLFTIYAPPNHIDGRVHHTRAEAEADREDEAFGEAMT